MQRNMRLPNRNRTDRDKTDRNRTVPDRTERNRTDPERTDRDETDRDETDRDGEPAQTVSFAVPDLSYSAAELEAVSEKVRTMIDMKRYAHTVGVRYTAAAMAMAFGYDPSKAALAGLLHDCGKRSAGELVRLCREEGIVLTEEEEKAPQILHGKYGAVLAERIFSIRDEDILNSIRYHTTGRPAMSLLEKIVFIADYIEPGREPLPRIGLIRRTAFADTDLCILMILEDTFSYLREQGRFIAPTAEKAYSFYAAGGTC